jgi:hypothetical protein
MSPRFQGFYNCMKVIRKWTIPINILFFVFSFHWIPLYYYGIREWWL